MISSERLKDNDFLNELRICSQNLLSYGILCSVAFRHRENGDLKIDTAHWNYSGQSVGDFYKQNPLYEEGIYISINPQAAAWLMKTIEA